MSSEPKEKKYDILLFGSTGFTGKLALEYLLTKNYPIRLGCCVRNKSRLESSFQSIIDHLLTQNCTKSKEYYESILPQIEIISTLTPSTDQDLNELRSIVQSSKVVLTTAGPFALHGKTLVKVCAEEGVHYADVTGETDFVRSMILENDELARKNHASIVVHCGNDCIPWDMSVWELNEWGKKNKQQEGKKKLKECFGYCEFPSGGSLSGGTLNTAIHSFQNNKDNNKKKTEYDPLLRSSNGHESTHRTKITIPRQSTYYEEFNQNGASWIMTPVMANCIRRSNALLGYHHDFRYAEVMLDNHSILEKAKRKMEEGLIGAAVIMPSLFQRFLPSAGEGPERESMEDGCLVLKTRGVWVDDDDEQQKNSETAMAIWRVDQDTGYLYTAKFLVESGMVLLEEGGKDDNTGVITPAVAFGGTSLMERLMKEAGYFQFEIVDEGKKKKDDA